MKIKRMVLLAIVVSMGTIAAGIGLFAMNGILLASGETPISGTHPDSQTAEILADLKIMAWNVAKGSVHKGGMSFVSKETALLRMKDIAEVIRAESPDLVFLSEAVFECGPCPVNQITSLAQATGIRMWAFGENYNFGLPFYRIVGGNAILSRHPVEPVGNPDLSGRKPFYVTTNNRRVLWCRMQIGEKPVLLASVHNDSFDSANNLNQTRQLIDFAGEGLAILAGDFNATPDSPSVRLIRETGRFVAAFDGPMTFPSDKPKEKIDFIFVPKNWELTGHRVVRSDASDHLPVISVFKIPEASCSNG